MTEKVKNALVKLEVMQPSVLDVPKLLPVESLSMGDGIELQGYFTEDRSQFFMTPKSAYTSLGINKGTFSEHYAWLTELGEIEENELVRNFRTNQKTPEKGGRPATLLSFKVYSRIAFRVGSKQALTIQRAASNLLDHEFRKWSDERYNSVAAALQEAKKLAELESKRSSRLFEEKSELQRTLSNIHVSVARIGDVTEVSRQVQSLIKAVARAECAHPKKIEGAVRREFKGAGGYKLIAAQSASQVVSFLTNRLLAATTNQRHPTIPGIELGYDPHVNLRKPKSR